MSCRILLAGLLLAAAAACETTSEPSRPDSPGTPKPDAALGRIAFEAECGTCHASRDGVDLRAFGFTDTTIIRRAVAHVDTATARNIVAYIHTLQSPRLPEEVSILQPGGSPVASDLEFATALFGRDEWPAGLTTAQLQALDPRTVRVAIRFPIWSDEGTNLDWMPDLPLPAGILDYQGGMAAAAIAGYRAVPTRENLTRAIAALRTADRTTANPGAPCLLDDPARVNYRECFEVRRWVSSLAALHLLRFGMDQSLGSQVHDIWWDVGNVARRSRADRSVPIANPVPNWASWMYLGWSFDPSRHASVYTGGGLRQMGLVRHATFIALRSQVARPRASMSPYDDAFNAVNFSPMGWSSGVATFSLQHLRERLQNGDRPAADQVANAVVRVNGTVQLAVQKAPPAAGPAIQALGQQVLALLSP